jgi:hypothetical protein
MALDLTAEQQAKLAEGNNPFLGLNGSSPYLQGQIDSASQDVVNNYNLTTQPAFNKAMVGSGSFGNAGVAQMNADAQSQLQKNLGNLSNSMRQQDYTNQQNMYQWQQGLNNNQSQFAQNLGENQRQYNNTFGEGQRQFDLGYGRTLFNDAYSQNMNNLTTGMGLLGTLGQYNQGDITNSTNQQNTPLNYWQQFSQGANALGGQGGTTTQGTTSNPLTSALGGAQLGAAAGNWWNQNYGNTPISQSNQNAFDSFGASNNWWGTGAST